jgi:hypothetical protein
MSLEYKVPRLLWENLESVLLAQSKRYIAELARHLDVPEKELIRRVLPTNDSLKVIIQDSQAESQQCSAYVQQDQLTVYCKKTVAYQSPYCLLHRCSRMFVVESKKEIPIQRVKPIDTVPPIWIQGERDVINSKGHVVGRMNHTKQTMKLFVLE